MSCVTRGGWHGNKRALRRCEQKRGEILNDPEARPAILERE